MTTETASTPRRWLFTLTIFAGSFLLFLVQPMVARMALPRLGGASNVWNSAMLVYQALLLAGYAYAHVIGRYRLRTQGLLHLAVLIVAALTLPLALAPIAEAQSGWEVLWVPWLFLLTVGPAFFAISAQAPLIQRWFAAHPHAGNPYPLYAASNLGSFAGLLTYPLLAEPLLTLGSQSRAWAVGYGVLVLLVALAVYSRRDVTVDEEAPAESGEVIGWKRKALWLLLPAVPSGLMLSTTTYLTTDIMAIPLLWVIPLGLYLLSYSIAFAENRGLARIFIFLAPLVVLVDGGIAIFAAGRADLLAAIASIVLLFVVATALHGRLYDLRPGPQRLSQFYLYLSAGGALGGVFTALLAPILFDWTWEHPLLILAAAALVPLGAWRGLLPRLTSNPQNMRIVLIVGVFLVFNGALLLFGRVQGVAQLGAVEWAALLAILCLAMILAARRLSFVLACAAVLLSLGGISNLRASLEGERERSYFGTYSITQRGDGDRILMHGTTIHGIQRAGEDALEPTAYYGETSGVGLALRNAERIVGPDARIGAVGLGVGTLACYRQPGQDWTFFEIDPTVLQFSQAGDFTFIERCAPDARMLIGDARLRLEALPAGSFDILVIDAFSSDAIPLHLLTAEAMAIYERALAPGGLLLLHTSNRYVRLEPVVARLAEERGLNAMLWQDEPVRRNDLYNSTWIALAPRRDPLDALSTTADWRLLSPTEGTVWTDDYASVLPYLVWENFL
ncbi:fused MFS/spermidine synthase [Aurantiacibacter poecillastricola]|uniref:fused MFS/spermidine synthase n=1 Tax=Aurantiacibacter poecillastricola TaxID=3064385 RepID=UPI0027403030|nr:fused MFS/spermidine synthase [Aurantiacibacter sp. 219JJ12-13]MDP5260481.1 fused MFS/spermidine synthase [Aurantiacibacter sp. 219JJ12-13]